MRLLPRLMRPTGSTRLGGPAVEAGPRRLRIEDTWCQTLIVTGYPRDVTAGWAEPLLAYPGRCDIAAHITPVPPPVAAERLRRRRARLESAWRHEAARGRVEDVQAGTAAEDAAGLAQRLATGGRLFRLGLYITVYADTETELAEEIAHLQALASSLLIDTAPATFRPLHGWIATLPLGTDPLASARTMDTDAVAALLPFTSPDLDTAGLGETSVVWGTNTHSAGLVLWDRFAPGIDNHNMVVLARSGAGKSYLAKLELLRSLMTGIEAAVIDPEDEYAALAAAVGGTRVAVGTPTGRINPFDLPTPQTDGDTDGDGQGSGLMRRALFIHTLVATMVGELDAATAAALDEAILTAYAHAGITADTRTWNRTPPVLADLADVLRAQEGTEVHRLADRLRPYTHGAYQTLFDGPTSTGLEGHLVVYSLRHLPAEAADVGMLLVLDRLWRRITEADVPRPRLVTVDEAWLLLQNPVAATYLQRMAKAARKHWAGLTLITQDVGDVLSTDTGRAVAANAATQVLLRQAPQNLEAVTSAFQLSQGERQTVAAAQRGDALLLAGHQRVGVHPLASPQEHALLTTSPAEHADAGGEEEP